MPDPTSTEERNRMQEPVIVQASDYRILYSNTLRLQISQQDVGVTFGVNLMVPGQGFRVQELVTVMMTPAQAALLADKLQEALGRQTGQIIVPNLKFQ